MCIFFFPQEEPAPPSPLLLAPAAELMYGGNPFSPTRRRSRKRGKSNRQPGFASSDRTLELLREAARKLSLYQRRVDTFASISSSASPSPDSSPSQYLQRRYPGVTAQQGEQPGRRQRHSFNAPMRAAGPTAPSVNHVSRSASPFMLNTSTSFNALPAEPFRIPEVGVREKAENENNTVIM